MVAACKENGVGLFHFRQHVVLDRIAPVHDLGRRNVATESSWFVATVMTSIRASEFSLAIAEMRSKIGESAKSPPPIAINVESIFAIKTRMLRPRKKNGITADNLENIQMQLSTTAYRNVGGNDDVSQFK